MKAEWTYPELAVGVHQQIAGFDIAVYDARRVQILETCRRGDDE